MTDETRYWLCVAGWLVVYVVLSILANTNDTLCVRPDSSWRVEAPPRG